MAEIQELKIQVKINAETKQLEVVNAELQNTNKNISDIKNTTPQTAEAIGGLIKKYFSLIAVISSLNSVVRASLKNYEEENVRQRQLSFTLKALNIDYLKHKERIEEVLGALAAQTRLTRDELFDAFNRLLRITGDVDQAFKLLKISLDVSVGTGKNFNETMEKFVFALSSGGRGVNILAKEFKSLVDVNKPMAENIKNIGLAFENAAITEKSLAKETGGVKETFQLLAGTLGKELAPAAELTIKTFKVLTVVIGELLIGAVKVFQTIGDAIGGVGLAIYKTLTFRFKEAGQALQISGGMIVDNWKDYGKQIGETLKSLSENSKKTSIDIKDFFVKGLRETETESEKQTKEIQKNFEKLKEEFERKGIGDIFQKIIESNKNITKERLNEILRAYLNTYDEIFSKVEDISRNMHGVLAGSFENSMRQIIEQGQFTGDSLKLVFENIFESFRNMLIRMMAEMLARAVVFSLLNIFTGGAMSIGGVPLGKILGGFQTGGTVPETGKYILHKGEKVIPRGNVENANNKSVSINFNVSAFDIRQIDNAQINRLSRQIAPYIKNKLGL